MTEYMTTREQCQSEIKGVCSGCGGPLEPIETVDNAKRPTFWSGCVACSQFKSGVDPRVFLVARTLVTEHRLRPYKHLNEGDYQYLESQTEGATSIVIDVLRAASVAGLTWPVSKHDSVRLDSGPRPGVQKKRPRGGGDSHEARGLITQTHYTQPHLRERLERANSKKSAGEGVKPRDRRNTTRGPHADGLAPASRAQLPVGGKGAFASELHQRAGVEEKMGRAKSVKRQAGSRIASELRGFDPPQPGPEYVTLSEALRMAGCRAERERRIMAGIPTVKSGRRIGFVGRRPTLIRREHAERVALVCKAADLSVEAAARVVAAELEGRI